MIIKKNDDRDLLSTDVIGSSVARSKRWLVAIVRICHEKKTGERLTKMGIENFLPIQQEVHQWSDRRKIVDRVLLPMMIFVHVPDQQMLRFKFMLDYSDETISMSTSPLAPGEKIRVIKGPLAGLEGELVHVNGKSKVAVRLTMLGCACVDIPAGCVEPVSENGDLRD